MKIEKIKISAERQLLIGMITSTSFLKKIAPITDLNYFDMQAASMVGRWVLDYFKEYSEAPKEMMLDIFSDKAEDLKKGDRKWIQALLESVNKEYLDRGFNETYIFNKSLRFFRKQRLRKSHKKIGQLLDDGKVGQAERLWIESRALPQELDLGFDPFSAKSVTTIFKKDKSRVRCRLGIPELDKMVGDVKSGWLVMFMGPQKRGKTWTLQHVAISACLQGLNVVFISLESEEEDMAFRFWMNIGSLTKSKKKIEFPYFINKKRGDDIKFKKRKRPIITQRSVKSAIKDFNQISGGRLILKVFPMGSAGLPEINQYLDALVAYKAFSPHMIIVDYLGIMKAPPKTDKRDKYNENAIGLKALGQERDSVVCTGHQGRRDTLEKLSIGVMDVPEDIRLLGHVDVLCGINQTELERDMGVMRYSSLIHRHRKYTSKYQVKVLQQLEAGQILLDDLRVEAPSLLDTGIDTDEKIDLEDYLE